MDVNLMEYLPKLSLFEREVLWDAVFPEATSGLSVTDLMLVKKTNAIKALKREAKAASDLFGREAYLRKGHCFHVIKGIGGKLSIREEALAKKFLKTFAIKGFEER